MDSMEKKRYHVYILSCADDSLYTGMTCDLDRRLSEHQAGRGAQWTQRRLPIKLIFSLNDLSYRAACEVERYIKSLTRARKELLIARDPRTLSLVEKRIVQ
ncbi:MAG: GIY-YIG nuclease family protein [Chloroflexi bacterium]|nr:GIY-YIG nuclease family protein [Chloroflexota bacterium]